MNTDKQACGILVVEEDEDLRESLFEFLTEEGYPVDAVGNGPAALQRLAAPAMPRLVLLGLALPGMAGWKVLDTLRSFPAERAPKVAVLTSDPKVTPEGVVATLRKPFRLEELMQVVIEHCGLNAGEQI